MPKFRVYLSKVTEIGVTVEAPDPDSAIEAAYDHDVPGVCAQCSGYGRDWSRDENDVMEPEAVFEGSSSGPEVWGSGQRWARVSDSPSEGSR